MKAVEFIEEDIRRSNRRTWPLVALLLAVLSMSFGLGARRDFIDAFLPENLIPALFLLLVGGALPWIYSSRSLSQNKKWTMLFVVSTLILLISLIQPQTPVSLKKFEPQDRFWPETFHCLGLGFLTSFVCSVALTWLTHLALPSPNRSWERACAWISGVCGLSALTFHCMGPLWSHIIIAHWGQAILIFPIAYFQQKLLFRFQMRQVLKKNQHLKL